MIARAMILIIVAAAALSYSRQAAASERRWVPERCETVTDWVLVTPRRTERRWQRESVVVSYDSEGRPARTVTPGCWRDVEIAARYEPRTRQVVIPGHWEDVPTPNNKVAESKASCQDTVVIDRRAVRAPCHDTASGTQTRINAAGLAAANREYQAATGQPAPAVQRRAQCDNAAGSGNQAVINAAGLAAANQAYQEATGQGRPAQAHSGDRAK
jgi:hypothetical protein